jgi:hypothetical protein
MGNKDSRVVINHGVKASEPDLHAKSPKKNIKSYEHDHEQAYQTAKQVINQTNTLKPSRVKEMNVLLDKYLPDPSLPSSSSSSSKRKSAENILMPQVHEPTISYQSPSANPSNRSRSRFGSDTTPRLPSIKNSSDSGSDGSKRRYFFPRKISTASEEKTPPKSQLLENFSLSANVGNESLTYSTSSTPRRSSEQVNQLDTGLIIDTSLPESKLTTSTTLSTPHKTPLSINTSDHHLGGGSSSNNVSRLSTPSSSSSRKHRYRAVQIEDTAHDRTFTILPEDRLYNSNGSNTTTPRGGGSNNLTMRPSYGASSRSSASSDRSGTPRAFFPSSSSQDGSPHQPAVVPDRGYAARLRSQTPSRDGDRDNRSHASSASSGTVSLNQFQKRGSVFKVHNSIEAASIASSASSASSSSSRAVSISSAMQARISTRSPRVVEVRKLSTTETLATTSVTIDSRIFDDHGRMMMMTTSPNTTTAQEMLMQQMPEYLCERCNVYFRTPEALYDHCQVSQQMIVRRSYDLSLFILFSSPRFIKYQSWKRKQDYPSIQIKQRKG